MNPITAIQVYYQPNEAPNKETKQLVGKLVMQDRRPVFGYDKQW